MIYLKHTKTRFFSILLLILIGQVLFSSLRCCFANSQNMQKNNNKEELSKILNYPQNPGPFKLVSLKNKNNSISEYWQARGETGHFGGAVTVSTFGAGPKTFNNWVAADVTSHGLSLLLHSPLLDNNPWTGKPEPKLAKSVTISKDGKEYLIKLRKGLLWSDGKSLTADDVIFTFNTLIAKGYGNSSARDLLTVYGKFPRIEKIDNLTISFKTEVPFAPFLNNLVTIGIAPKHILEPITKKPLTEFLRIWDTNCDPKTIVGCGPFKLERYVPGQRVEFVRNDKYSFIDKQNHILPYLDRFIMTIVPNQATEILSFYNGDLNLLDIRQIRGSDAALMKSKEKHSNFKMHLLGPDDATTFLMFNMNPRKNPKTNKTYVDPIKQKWFNNTKFRQAISHAISRKRIISNALKGVGATLYTAFTPASDFYNSSLTEYPQDIEYAKKLLKEAGFINKENKLYDQENNRVEFTLHTNSGNSIRDAVCVMIKDDLAKLGIKVNYQPIEFNIMVNKTENSLDWEAIVMSLTGTRHEPYETANVWKSNGRLHMFDQRLPDSTGNIVARDARDWEKRIDKLFDEGATSLDDRKRHKYFNEFQKIVYEEQPFIYLFCPLLITASSNNLGNYLPTSSYVNYTPLGTFHNIEEIYLKKEIRH